MTQREANLLLMAHWSRSWTTLGRWQELNSRLTRHAPTRPGVTRPSHIRNFTFDRPAGARFGDLGASE